MLAVTALGFIAPTAHVDVSSDDVDTEAAYSFTVNQDEAKIDVSVDVELVLQKSTVVDDGREVHLALVNWPMVLPSTAVDVVAVDSRGPLSVDLNPSDKRLIANVQLGRRVFAGRKHQFTLTYSLPDNHQITVNNDKPLDLVVVNQSAAAWLFTTDSSIDRWSATLTAPDGFVLSGGQTPTWTSRPPAAGVSTWTTEGSTPLADFVVLDNIASLNQTIVDIGGREMVIRHWPDDLEWRDHIVSQVSHGLPILIELLGDPWSTAADQPLVIEQSARTLGTSYSGWYTVDRNTITIGPLVDETLVVHELAHLWFNYETFDDRWLIEGLAEEFAQIAVHGADAVSPDTGDPRRPLKEWTVDDEGAQNFDDEPTETNTGVDIADPDPTGGDWAYAHSWTVVHQTRQALGTEAFSELTASILAGNRPYADSAAPSAPAGPTINQFLNPKPVAKPSPDRLRWTEFLDLAADMAVGASTDTSLDRLYADWVEGHTSNRFDQRSDARARYQQLARSEWPMPLAVRRPIRDWAFAEADVAMDSAEQFHARAEEMKQELVLHELDLPVNSGQLLSAAATVAEVETLADRLQTATNGIVAAETEVTDRSFIQRIGMLGFDLADTRQRARSAFTAGDLDQAAGDVALIRNAVAKSESVGYLRMAGAGMAALAVLAVASALVARPRRLLEAGTAMEEGRVGDG